MKELSTNELQKLARDHLWMHNRDWEQMGERAEPLVVVKGTGIRVEDSEGNSEQGPLNKEVVLARELELVRFTALALTLLCRINNR